MTKTKGIRFFGLRVCIMTKRLAGFPWGARVGVPKSAARSKSLEQLRGSARRWPTVIAILRHPLVRPLAPLMCNSPKGTKTATEDPIARTALIPAAEAYAALHPVPAAVVDHAAGA